MSMESAEPIHVPLPRCKLLIAVRRIAQATCVAVIVVFTLNSCSPVLPATARPPLAHTPGAYIVVSNGHVESGSFEFDYPSSWRLVKQSAANADGIDLVLLAPDGGKVELSQVEAQGTADGNFIALTKGGGIQVSIDVSGDSTSKFDSQVERLIKSIRG